MAERSKLALVVAAWIIAGLNLGLLFDVKATTTTLLALLLLTALALPSTARPPAIAIFVAPAVVFAAVVVQPLVGLAALALVLAAIAWSLRWSLAGVRDRWLVAAAAAATLWPPILGLVSNSVVEVFCPGGGIDQTCHGFHRVGTD